MCYHSERLSNPIPPQWTQACIRLFSQDNVSSLLHVETNTQPRVLAPSIYLAPLEPWRWVGRRGNNFSVIIVITSAPYHCGCLSKKSCIGVVLHEDDAVTPPRRVLTNFCMMTYMFMYWSPFDVHYTASQLTQIASQCPGIAEGRGLVETLCSASE